MSSFLDGKTPIAEPVRGREMDGFLETKSSTAVSFPSSSSRLDDEFFGICTSLPEGLSSFDECVDFLNHQGTLSQPCEKKNLPMRKAKPMVQFTLTTVKEGGDDSPRSQNNKDTSDAEAWCADCPYAANIVNAEWLTPSAATSENMAQRKASWGDSRRVVNLDIALGDSQIAYLPGDSIGIIAPNPAYLVQAVYQQLKEVREGTVNMDTIVTMTGSGETYSLKELLTYRLDLASVPRKANVFSLSKYCTDTREELQMQWLCSKCAVGKKLWDTFIEQQHLGYGELLHLFPSCAITLEALLTSATRMAPRHYSAASSPLHEPDIISIAFSIVHYKCHIDVAPPNKTIDRAGLCTSYLEKLAQQWLYPSVSRECDEGIAGFSTPQLRIFHKSSNYFRLPGSVAHPLILIGPGTGISPFIGFLQHRRHIEAQRCNVSAADDACEGVWRGGFEIEEEDLQGETLTGVQQFITQTPPGPVHLFFGCRNDDDFLYKSQLNDFVSSRTLTKLDVAFSRTQAQKIYVTHKIRARAQELASLIIEEGAYIYVCGDGNHMAKDVNNALLDSLTEFGNMSPEDATELLCTLKSKRRYMLDIWS